MAVGQRRLDTGEGGSSLVVLGISPAEEVLYRAMLRAPGSTTQVLAGLLHVDTQSVEMSADALQRKGFATYTPDKVPRWFPCPPDIAVETLLIQRQNELTLARYAVVGLQREQNGSTEHERLVEIIGADPAAQRQPYVSSHDRAVTEVLCLVRPPFLVSTPGRQEDARADARKRGVRYRNIVHPDVLALPGWLERLQQDVDAGEEVRLLEHFPFKMIVADRDLGLLPLKIDEPTGPMLLLRRSAVLDALCELFEILWLRAVPLRFDADGLSLPGSTSQSHQLQRMLTLMAAGANDKHVADRLGISERTLMRRIDQMYQELNAHSRFQAGWLAALRSVNAGVDAQSRVVF